MESKLNIEYTYLTVFDLRLSHRSLKGACMRQYEPNTTGCNNMAERCLSEKMLFMTNSAVIFLRRGSRNAICNACTEHACAHRAFVFPRKIQEISIRRNFIDFDKVRRLRQSTLSFKNQLEIARANTLLFIWSNYDLDQWCFLQYWTREREHSSNNIHSHDKFHESLLGTDPKQFWVFTE